jgi:hypothetical protein
MDWVAGGLREKRQNLPIVSPWNAPQKFADDDEDVYRIT